MGASFFVGALLGVSGIMPVVDSTPAWHARMLSCLHGGVFVCGVWVCVVCELYSGREHLQSHHCVWCGCVDFLYFFA